MANTATIDSDRKQESYLGGVPVLPEDDMGDVKDAVVFVELDARFIKCLDSWLLCKKNLAGIGQAGPFSAAAHYNAVFARENLLLLGVVNREGAPAGICYAVDRGMGNAELHLSIFEKAPMLYMRALKQVLRTLFEAGYERVFSLVPNHKLAMVLGRWGAMIEGEIRNVAATPDGPCDVYCVSVMRDEYSNTRGF